MKEEKFFIPRDFREIYEDSPGFSGLARGFFKSAVELLNNVEKEQNKYSCHVLSSIVLFTTSIEGYFNEILNLSLYKAKDDEKMTKRIEALKVGYESDIRLNFSEKIKQIFKAYDKQQKGIDTNGNTFQDLIALIALRNKIAHYNPNWNSFQKYPKDLELFHNRCKIKLERAGWTTNYSNIEVGLWAKQTVKKTIEEFSRISGAENPFSTEDSNKYTCWD